MQAQKGLTYQQVLDIVQNKKHQNDPALNARLNTFIKQAGMDEYMTKQNNLSKTKYTQFINHVKDAMRIKRQESEDANDSGSGGGGYTPQDQSSSLKEIKKKKGTTVTTTSSVASSPSVSSQPVVPQRNNNRGSGGGKGLLGNLEREDYLRLSEGESFLDDSFMKDGLIDPSKYKPQITQYYKGGPTFPFFQSNVGGAITDKFGSNKNLLAKVTADYFKPSHLSAFPSYIYNPQRKTAQAKDEYRALFTKQRQNQNSALLKDLAKKYDTVTWNPTQKYWQVPGVITQSFRPRDQKRWRKNVVWGNFFLQKNLSKDEIIQYIPPLVGQLVQSNANFSKGGIGPLSSKSLPFYAGRFLDVNSGRIRTLPKASNKYLDPISYDAKMSYLQARLINKWNQYVMSQQQILKFAGYNKDQWEKSAKEKLVKGLTTDFKGSSANAVKKWYLGQIQLYQVGAPLQATSRVVLSTIPNYPKQWEDFTLSLTAEDTVADRGQLADILNRQLARVSGTTMQDVKKRNQLTFSFGTWLNKGKWSRKSAITKLFKTLIPQNLSQEDLIEINEWRITNPSVFNKTGNLNITKANIQQIFKNKPADIKQFERLVNKHVSSIGGEQLATTSSPYTQKFKQPKVYPTAIQPKSLL